MGIDLSVMETSSITRESRPGTRRRSKGPAEQPRLVQIPLGMRARAGTASGRETPTSLEPGGKMQTLCPPGVKSHPTWMETCVDRVRIGRDD